jgi:hypothetical protein
VGLKLVFDFHEAATEMKFHALSRMFSVANGKEQSLNATFSVD